MVDKLGLNFYLEEAISAARNLLGAVLIHETPEGTASGIIVETEAYLGKDDAASHAYGRDTRGGRRSDAMFAAGGHAYVYLIYGIHCCFNIVTGHDGSPQGVLIRSLEPRDGIELMASRRGTDNPRLLCSGPGRLCQALAITRLQNGADLTRGPLYLTRGIQTPRRVLATPRIGVDYAGGSRELPYRFVWADPDKIRWLSGRKGLRETPVKQD